MTLKIQNRLDESNCMTFSFSGRIQSEHVVQLSVLLKQERRHIMLDLTEVTLVDSDAVRFLAACETQGSELRNCPAFCTRVDPQGKMVS
jgi:anti-anti-sigma regulatory factor